MGFYLLDHPNPNGPRFYKTRKNPVLACVVHVTAGLQGKPDATDTSAEKTAKYASTTDRKVSWHSGSDTDSQFLLLPDAYTAFQCQGYNSQTIGHEISKTDVSWADEKPEWVTETLNEAAKCLRPRLLKLGIPFVKITKRQLDAGKKGLVSHSDLDPSRRRDPGPDFPWDRFIKLLGTGIAQGDRWLGLKSPAMNGHDVGNVQDALVKHAVFDPSKKTYVYDRYTADGVRAFQNNNDITERGCGPQTWKALRASARG